jgi:hypothetical protein
VHEEHPRVAGVVGVSGKAGAPGPATLDGRFALVTGSASGIGRVIASALEAAGRTVWRLDKCPTSAGADER